MTNGINNRTILPTSQEYLDSIEPKKKKLQLFPSYDEYREDAEDSDILVPFNDIRR